MHRVTFKLILELPVDYWSNLTQHEMIYFHNHIKGLFETGSDRYDVTKIVKSGWLIRFYCNVEGSAISDCDMFISHFFALSNVILKIFEKLRNERHFTKLSQRQNEVALTVMYRAIKSWHNLIPVQNWHLNSSLQFIEL